MLKKLALYDSAPVVKHDKWVSAYEGLEELHLHQSNVYTHDPEFDEKPEFTQYSYDSPFQFWCPSDFSALKALRIWISGRRVVAAVTQDVALNGPCMP